MRTPVRMYAVSVLTLGSLLGQTLAAQVQSGSATHGHASDMSSKMSTMADCPMMAAMMQDPDAVLSNRKALGLTDVQVKRLEIVRATEMQAVKQPMDSMMAIHKQFSTLSQAPQFDENAVRRVFDRMGALHTVAGTAMLRARHDAGAVLTVEQRTKLTDDAGTMGTMSTSGMNMSGMNMSGMSTSGMNMSGMSTSGMNMSGTAGKGMTGGMASMKSMMFMMSMMGMPGCAMMHDGTGARTNALK